MADQQPTALRCEHQDAPLLVPTLTPSLSWHPPRELRQAKWRIRFTVEGRESTTTSWAQGNAPAIVWPGHALGYDQRVEWQVQVADETGTQSAWSEPACFETGPDPASWSDIAWIGSDLRGAPLFRCRFALDGPRDEVVAARWYWSALGVAELSLNGEVLTEPGMSSWQSDPRSRLEVHGLAISGLGASNVLGVELAGGFHERFQHGRRAFRCCLVIDYRSGARQRVGSQPAEWQMRGGAVHAEDPYDGEGYDARHLPVGWNHPESSDQATKGWHAVVEQPSPAGRVVAARCGRPGIRAEHAPVEVRDRDAATKVVDFGRMISGCMRIEGRGRNSVLTMRFGEELADGELLTRGNRRALCTDRYTFGGHGEECWSPRFSSRSFRACEVTCHGKWPDGLRFTGLDIHDPSPSVATFRCSHEGLTRLFDACVTTFQHNLVGMLRDCPHRDERLGWLGDALTIGPSVLGVVDSAAIFRRWLEEIAATQHPTLHHRWAAMAPADPMHVIHEAVLPDAATLPQDDNVYTAAGTLLPWHLYEATGDESVLRDHFDRIVAHLSIWPQRDDWPSVDASRHGDHAAVPLSEDYPTTPKALVSGAMLLEEYRCAMAMADVLGRAADELTELADALGNALQQHYGEAMMDAASSQGVIALGLDMGLCPDVDRGLKALEERLERDDCRITTGIILTRQLLSVLGRFGLHEQAYRMVTRKQCPGWLWMLDAGPGTLHENLVDHWGFVSRDQPGLGMVVEWMLRDLLGFRRQGRRCRVEPPGVEGLSWAEGTVPTPWGSVGIRWERTNDGTRVQVDALQSLELRVKTV